MARDESQKKIKRILIATELFPPDFSGAGLRAFRLAKHMHERYGHEFDVLCFKKAAAKESSYPYMRIHRLKIITPKIFFPIYLLELFLRVSTFHLKRRKKIAAIHLFGFFWLNRIVMISNLIFLRKRAMYEITLYGDDDPDGMVNKNMLNKMLGPFILWMAQKMEVVVALNQKSVKSCIKCGIQRSHVWYRPNPVDECQFRPRDEKENMQLRKRLGLGNGPVLISIGIIQDRKNQLFLIKCLARLKSDSATLLLAGPYDKGDSYYKKLKDHIHQYGLGLRVRFLGNRKDTPQLLSASDVFVFASDREGFSNTIGEALLTGIPIVTLDLDEISKYVTHRNGIVIKRDYEDSQIENFSAAVDQLLSRRHEFDRDAAREISLPMLSSDRIYKQYQNIYLRMLETLH